jgi:dCTP deaminase
VILTGPEIRRQIAEGGIRIDPYVPEHVNQSSVDLTLGDEVVTYDMNPFTNGAVFELDARVENKFERKKIGKSITLAPGTLYLMHTVERVHTDKFAIMIDGKSSLGRLGVLVHMTAGYVDPGFDGQYTLEVTCVLPVRLYAGMRVCQIRFHTLHGELESYQERGNYVGERAVGPVPSQSWRQFK